MTDVTLEIKDLVHGIESQSSIFDIEQINGILTISVTVLDVYTSIAIRCGRKVLAEKTIFSQITDVRSPEPTKEVKNDG